MTYRQKTGAQLHVQVTKNELPASSMSVTESRQKHRLKVEKFCGRLTSMKTCKHNIFIVN